MAGHLLTSQKNELLQRIKNAGLNPAEFQWKVENPQDLYGYQKEIGLRLVHTPTAYYCSFIDVKKLPTDRMMDYGRRDGPHGVHFSPHSDYVEGGNTGIKWSDVLHGFDIWVSALKREYEAPDLWKQLREGHLPTLKPDVDERSTFSPDEVKRVENGVDQLIKKVRKDQRKLGLSDEQTEWMAGEFESLKRAVQHSDKRQFVYMLVGTVISVAVALTLAPDRTRELFQLVGKWFDWLVEISYYLPKG